METPVIRILPLAALPLVAACDPATMANLGLAEPPAPEEVVLPPNVVAALPPGAPASVVFQAPDGCYLISVELTDPRSGFPVRDAAGNPICEGGAPPAAL